MLGIPFTVQAADVDERSIEYRTPRELATKAAFAKASEVGTSLPEGSIVVAADTIVVLGNKVYGKPESEAEACLFLSELAGHAHTVITGVAIQETGKSTLIDAVESLVYIQSLNEAQIREYVATGEPMDKAGAYAAQGRGRALIQRIDGDFFNVVGLPAAHLLQMLSTYIDISPYRAALKKLTPDTFDSAQLSTG